MPSGPWSRFRRGGDRVSMRLLATVLAEILGKVAEKAIAEHRYVAMSLADNRRRIFHDAFVLCRVVSGYRPAQPKSPSDHGRRLDIGRINTPSIKSGLSGRDGLRT